MDHTLCWTPQESRCHTKFATLIFQPWASDIQSDNRVFRKLLPSGSLCCRSSVTPASAVWHIHASSVTYCATVRLLHHSLFVLKMDSVSNKNSCLSTTEVKDIFALQKVDQVERFCDSSCVCAVMCAVRIKELWGIYSALRNVWDKDQSFIYLPLYSTIWDLW